LKRTFDHGFTILLYKKVSINESNKPSSFLDINNIDKDKAVGLLGRRRAGEGVVGF
jgi:hypothetical protein